MIDPIKSVKEEIEYLKYLNEEGYKVEFYQFESILEKLLSLITTQDVRITKLENKHLIIK